MLCPRCKGELPDNATFCTNCGAIITTEVNATKHETTRLNYSVNAMEVIVPDEKKKGKAQRSTIRLRRFT